MVKTRKCCVCHRKLKKKHKSNQKCCSTECSLKWVVIRNKDPKVIAKRKAIRDGPKEKAKRKAIRDGPKEKARRKAYRNIPAVKAKEKAIQQTLEAKAKAKLIRDTPKAKAKAKIKGKAYRALQKKRNLEEKNN